MSHSIDRAQIMALGNAGFKAPANGAFTECAERNKGMREMAARTALTYGCADTSEFAAPGVRDIAA